MQKLHSRYWLLIAVLFIACSSQIKNQKADMNSSQPIENGEFEVATLGGGCFWCVEAVYQRLKGVQSVASGYSGGKIANPSYREICTGRTGHAEVAQITFDPKVISYAEILEVFWRVHDPTTLNRQGNDIGTQYRSVIFYHDEKQKETAIKSKKSVEESGLWSDPIVTEISALTKFYKAEDYHQNYFNDNRQQPYCVYVVDPKVEKFKKEFKDKVKKEDK
jgi:peptide-methionine (S)-S-oxide reductase